MFKRFGLLALVAMVPGFAFAQTPATQPPPAQAAPANPTNPSTVCGLPIPTPRALPPENSGPVIFLTLPCFEKQGNLTLIEPATYLYYIHTQGSRPSEGVWVPWTDTAERGVLEDFKRVWAQGFLDDMSIETIDYTFSNGVLGKIIVYNMEERQRVKIIDYTGSTQLKVTDIDEHLAEINAQIRTDAFIDAGRIRKVEGAIRDMLREKGFQAATVRHEITELAGGPKLVNLTFHMNEGPRVKIRRIDFEGNKLVSDGDLVGQIKENKPAWAWSFITKRGTFKEGLFEEDAERVRQYYLEQGFINAQVGDPIMIALEDTDGGRTRWVELRVPVVEGSRYRLGTLTFQGNKVLSSEGLRPLFQIKEGEFYNHKKIGEGFQKAQGLYGAGGHYEFSGYPIPRPRDAPDPVAAMIPPALVPSVDPRTVSDPLVDVTLNMSEGPQYFINRITFVGNTTTRDNVIRREMRIYEGGPLNTEQLQNSIKRINQLGYFAPLQGPPQDITIEKTPGADNKMDVKVRLEEQNRNQLTFGAGVSQFEGFFGQLAFQTANFLGRGESLTVSLQGGSRAQTYNVSFTEPFLFDRNITAGASVFRNEVRYVGQFTQKSAGVSSTLGFPLGTGFTRMFLNYSYERVHVTDVSEFYTDDVLARNPWLRDSLLIAQGGERIVSKIVPAVVYNTVDHPIFPMNGTRLSAAVDLAGLGGNTNFYKPRLEAIKWFRQNTRMTLGVRAQWEYVQAFGSTLELPIFERLFLGGEYSVRGFDLRTIAPQDESGLLIGGNKSLLFNVEQVFTIANPVRLILFYDAGQVQPGDQRFTDDLVVPGKSFSMQDFKTSTGAEIRFFMPVLNVPFRLIFAFNPQREGVLDNTLQPTPAYRFRFAVGTTF